MWPFDKIQARRIAELEAEVRELQNTNGSLIESCESLTESCKTYAEFVETSKKYTEDLEKKVEFLNSVLKGYAVWDDFIGAEIKRQSPGTEFKEGPATVYLKGIGEYHKKYGH